MRVAKFVKKAFGESNFVAVNTNPDGTDNPEGRKYNRRVTFGIVNPKTGVVLRQEAYHSKVPQTTKFNQIQYCSTQTKEIFIPAYFSNLIKDEMLFVRTIKTDSLNLYALGCILQQVGRCDIPWLFKRAWS